MPDLAPIYLSLKLALATTVALLLIGLPLSYFLSVWKSKFKLIVESCISLPIILPPTVIGFYLLVFLSPANEFGKFLDSIGIHLTFTFTGILIASMIYSFPFMIQPIQKALENTPKRLWDISYTLGKTKWETLAYIILPNIKHSIVTGIILTFAHTMGEFGVILMIGGNIPGETRVASLAIYSELEALDYQTAHWYSSILLVLSIIIIVLINTINRNKDHKYA